MKQMLLVLSVFALTTAEAKTVAYWPMNKSTTGDGDIVRCAISTDNDLVVNDATATFSACDIGWNLPPNADTTAKAASAGGFLVRQMLTGDSVKDGVLTNVCGRLASSLSPYHDFTVEGWAKLTTLPTKSDAKATSQMFFYMTLAEVGGWSWNLYRSVDADTLQINVRLTYDNGKGGTAAENLYFAAGLTEAELKDAWHHYALVYRQESATWVFYLDGIEKGSKRAANAVFGSDPIQYVNPRVNLSGCKSSTAQSLIGNLACWRVSDKALPASSLLSGVGTTVPEPTPSKTFAYWKLDKATDGFADSITNLNLTAGAGGVTKQIGEVIVNNPDSSDAFKGDSGANNGSVQIGSAYSDANKFLYLTDQDTLQPYFRDEDGWTIEGYVKRTGYHSNRFGTIFTICYAADGTTPLVALRAYGSTDDNVKYGFYDNSAFANFKIEDANFCTGEGLLPKDEWTHIALTLSYTTYTNVAQVVWKFYENGSLKKTLMAVKKPSSLKKIISLAIGGYKEDTSTNARIFVGALDSFRLSKGALAPAEFLCATSSVPTTVSNLAYWPMDNRNGAAVGDPSAGYAGYGFVTADGTVSGDSSRARGRVPERTGLPSRNAGSVAVAANSVFTAANLGADLNFGDTWSVEGYHKVSGSGATAVCGTYDATSGKGWKLVFDNSGASPAYRILAAADGTPFVDAAFSGVGKYCANDWNHVLLTHDKNGTWTLAVNGVAAGTLTSAPRAAMATSGVSGFFIAGGQYDLWRAATGILSVDDSIYEARKGLFVVVK